MNIKLYLTAGLKALIGDPTFHFALMGVGIFVLFHSVDRTSVVSIDPLQIRSSELALQRQLGVDQLPMPMREDAWRRVVEDEILYREALRLGLDDDDFQVKQRLIQKMLLLAEVVGEATEPSEAVLRSRYLEQQRSMAGLKGRFWFRSHFFQSENRGNAEDALAELASAPGSQVAADPFPLEAVVAGMGADALRERYGADFVEELALLPAGQWSGPLRSRYGWHVVYMEKFEELDAASFESQRALLRQQYLAEQRRQAYGRMMERLYQRYEVLLPDDAPQELRARIAYRAAP